MIHNRSAAPCGCIPGEWLCREGERLWQLVKDARKRGEQNGDWQDYDLALQNYQRHIGANAEENGDRDISLPVGADVPVPSPEQFVPSLSGRVRATFYALEMDDNLTYDEWDRIGKYLQANYFLMRQVLPVLIGDWLVYGEGHEAQWGIDCTQAIIFPEEYAAQTLRNYAYVCRNVPPAIRHPNLRMSHYKAVAGLKTDAEKIRWQKLAAENGWSSAVLGQAIQKERLALRSEGGVPNSNEDSDHGAWHTPAQHDDDSAWDGSSTAPLRYEIEEDIPPQSRAERTRLKAIALCRSALDALRGGDTPMAVGLIEMAISILESRNPDVLASILKDEEGGA